MFKYLLFDLDRTLWDFDGNAEITFQKMYRQFEMEELCGVDYATFHVYYRIVNDQLWEDFRNGVVSKEYLNIKRFSIPLEHFNTKGSIGRLSAELGDYYVQEGPKQKGLMPGTRHLLEYLKEKDCYTLCVITNGFSEAQIPKMHSSDIARYFKYFYLSEDLGYMKPDPRFFDAALNQLSVSEGHAIEKSECLVVGDDYKVDIQGSVRAGIPSLFYNRDHRFTGPYSFQPEFEVHHLSEIESIL